VRAFILQLVLIGAIALAGACGDEPEETARIAGEEARQAGREVAGEAVQAWEETERGLRLAANQTMTTTAERREEVGQEVSRRLARVEEDLAAFRSRLDTLGEEARADAQQALEELEAELDQAEAELERLRQSGGEAVEDARQGMVRALDELRAAYREAAGRFHRQGP